MKLFIIITLIACSYAEKLDRGYLPPESAATAGGSPGSLTAPGSGTGPGLSTSPSFGQTSGAPFGQPSGPTFGQGSAQIGPQAGSVQPGQSGVGQYTPQQYNQGGALLDAGRLGSQQTGYNQGLTPGGSAQGPSSNLGGQIRGTSPTFGGQAQGPAVYSGQVQPERARASIDRNAEILRYDNQNDGETFAYSFETSNGISAEESGVATNGVQAQGAFAYTGDDGQQYRVIYTADENGYRPQGDHLPTPPPIPEEILKSLAKNAEAAASGTQEGAYNPDEDLGVAINPQQYSGNYYGQGQPGQAAIGYQTNQGIPSKYSDSGVSPAGAAGIEGQGLQNQGPTSQYTGPSLSARLPGAVSGIGSPPNAQYSAPGANAPGSIGGQTSGPQYGASSSPATSGAQGIPSQTGIPSQYNAPGVSPTSPTISSGPGLSGSVMPGTQGYKQDSGYEYNSPGSSGPGRFGSQGPQVTIGQRPSSQYNTPGLTSAGSYRPGSQDSSSQVNPSIDSQYSSPSGLSGSSRPITGSGSGAPGITSINGGSPSRFAQQGSQNSGYNYNNPTNSALSGPSRSDLQNYPSQGSQSSPQYSGPTKSPFGTSSLNRPQGTPGYSGSGLGASNAARPSGSDDSQSQNNQYNAPFASTSDSARPKEQAQPGFNQRPQFGSSSPLGLGPQGTAGQGSNDGYQYNQPQTKFDGPSRNGAFPRPSGIDSQSSGPASTSQYNPASNGPSQGLGSLSPNQGLAPGNSGNTYSPSGSPTGPTISSNGLGYPRPSGSASQGYPSGPAIAGATNVAPGAIGQGSNLPSTGQYTSGPTSSPSGSVFPGTRPGSSLAQNQPGQSAGTKSPLPGSAPYQYNRPGSQGPLSGSSQTPFGTQPGNAFGSSGQNKPDQTAFGPSGQVTPSQVGSQSNGPLRQDRPGSIGFPSSFGPSAQTGPGQAGSQPNMRPSGQDKPTENFGGPRQPPSFSSDEGYKY